MQLCLWAYIEHAASLSFKIFYCLYWLPGAVKLSAHTVRVLIGGTVVEAHASVYYWKHHSVSWVFQHQTGTVLLVLERHAVPTHSVRVHGPQHVIFTCWFAKHMRALSQRDAHYNFALLQWRHLCFTVLIHSITNSHVVHIQSTWCHSQVPASHSGLLNLSLYQL